MGRKYCHLSRKSVESAVSNAEAGKQQAFVRSKVLVVIAYRGAPIVSHLLIEGEVTLYMDQTFDDPGKSMVAEVRRVCCLSDCPREVRRDLFQRGAKSKGMSLGRVLGPLFCVHV